MADDKLRPHEGFPEIWYDMDASGQNAYVAKLQRSDGTNEVLFDLNDTAEMSSMTLWDEAFEAGLRAGFKIANDRKESE